MAYHCQKSQHERYETAAISREFGSGGRTIGKLAAEHLGIPCYDAELIQKKIPMPRPL